MSTEPSKDFQEKINQLIEKNSYDRKNPPLKKDEISIKIAEIIINIENIVLPLVDINNYNSAFIISCLSIILDDIFIHHVKPDGYMVGMHKLIEMLGNKENTKISALNEIFNIMFNED